VNNDCVEVDELILEIADYKNDFADMAAEKLFRKCSTSWGAYQYLRDRVHDGWLPNDAVSSCAGLSRGFRCDYFSVTSTAMLMRSHERNFFEPRLSLSLSNRSLYRIF
jgi:hypothetical protein